MTNQHPATPTSQEIDKFFMLPLSEEERLTAAFCAGADQELEACIQLLDINGCPDKWIDMLRSTRRPKPPTLAEQGLKALRSTPCTEQRHYDAMFAALTRLAELEAQQ
jgi:hypothetical protein